MQKGVSKDLPFQIRILFFTTHKQLRAGRGSGSEGGDESGRQRRLPPFAFHMF